MSETIFEAPPEAPDAAEVAAVSESPPGRLDTDTNAVAVDFDPAYDDLPDELRDQLEQNVQDLLAERLGEMGLAPDGQPLPQMPPQVQAAVDEVNGQNYLTGIVQGLGSIEGFGHLQGVDPAAVIERAREVAPEALATLGFNREAFVAALLIAATDVAGEQTGEDALATEFTLLANAYGNDNRITPRELAQARAAAEEAFAHGADVDQAVRMGFVEATDVNLTRVSPLQRAAYYSRRAKLIHEAETAERRAAPPTAPQPVLRGCDIVAKYGKAATDHKVTAGLIPADRQPRDTNGRYV